MLDTEILNLAAQQQAKCQQYGADYLIADPDQIVGVSRDLMSGAMPLNGLRNPPVGETSGWYLWSGIELGQEADFFVPTHLYHLIESNSSFLPFLGLAPGWRFLTDGKYEDVWFDERLFDI